MTINAPPASPGETRPLDHPIVRADLAAILAEPLPWQTLAGQGIVLTGATGMIGAYLAATLLTLAAELQPAPRIDLLVRNRRKAETLLGPWLHKAPKVQIHAVPLNRLPRLPEAPRYIIHAASPASPQDYARDPVGVIEANALGTHALLDAYARSGEARFLLLSSAVYGATENLGPVTEDSFGAIPTLDVRNCYIESKRLAETLLASWQAQYGLDYRIGRIFHTFGPGLNLDDGRIFSTVLRAARARQAITLTSDGLAQRTFCYLADTVSALFYLLLKGPACTAYNVGNRDNELCIRDFAAIAAQLTTPPLPVHSAAPDLTQYLPATTSRGHPDTTRLLQLGWTPRHDVAAALDRTYRSLL